MTEKNVSTSELLSRIRELEYDKNLRQMIDSTLVFLSHHGWEAPRESFFHALARFLADTLKMDYVCIDKLQGNLLVAETLAVYFDGKFDDNVTYTLKDTPCGDVVGKNICSFTTGVRHLYNKDIVLQEMLAESYLGVTLFNSKNIPIGLIAVIGRKEVENLHMAETILKMVAVRASGELERMLAENELRESALLLNETGKIAKVGGWKIHVKSNTLTWTKEVYRIHELEENVPVTVDMAINFYDEKSRIIIQNAVVDAIATGKPFCEELEIITAKGNKLQIKALGNAELDANGNAEIVYGTFQDITEQKLIERKLNQLIADKDIFLSILAHDLKNPFNLLMGFSNLMIKNIDNYNREKWFHYLNIIQSISQNTYLLLEDLLLWSQAISGKLQLQMQSILLEIICHEILDAFANQAAAKSIFMRYVEPHRIYFTSDVHLLKTILRNLVSNAIKFTQQGGTVIIMAEEIGDNIRISVSDTGIGISPENLNKLFDDSIHFTTPGTEKEKGTGFGLSLCHEMVSKLGGKIWAESKPGVGSNFIFTLPYKN